MITYETLLFMSQSLESGRNIFLTKRHIHKNDTRNSNTLYQTTLLKTLFQNSSYNASIKLFNVLPRQINEENNSIFSKIAYQITF